jgi:hypothetical protein
MCVYNTFHFQNTFTKVSKCNCLRPRRPTVSHDKSSAPKVYIHFRCFVCSWEQTVCAANGAVFRRVVDPQLQHLRDPPLD